MGIEFGLAGLGAGILGAIGQAAYIPVGVGLLLLTFAIAELAGALRPGR